jgi:hypothetical protein
VSDQQQPPAEATREGPPKDQAEPGDTPVLDDEGET